jgi:hypothetical protein
MVEERDPGPADDKARHHHRPRPGLAGHQANRPGKGRAPQGDQQAVPDVVRRARREQQQPAHERGAVVLEAVILGREVGVEPDVRHGQRRAAVIAADIGKIGDLLGRAVDIRVDEPPRHRVEENRGADPETPDEPAGLKLGPPGPHERGRPDPQPPGLPLRRAEGDQSRRKQRRKQGQNAQRRPQAMVAFDRIDRCPSEDWAQWQREPPIPPIQAGHQHQSPQIDCQYREREKQAQMLHSLIGCYPASAQTATKCSAGPT